MSDIGAFNKFELLSNKTCYKACGYTDDDLDRPIIGIANSYNEMVSGHMNLRALAEQVKYGVYRAGGTPVEFGVIACCDGITDNHKGAYYVLPRYAEQHPEILPARYARIFDNTSLEEHVVLRRIEQEYSPIGKLPEHIRSIFTYAFSEMLNNAIEYVRVKHAVRKYGSDFSLPYQ